MEVGANGIAGRNVLLAAELGPDSDLEHVIILDLITMAATAQGTNPLLRDASPNHVWVCFTDYIHVLNYFVSTDVMSYHSVDSNEI